MRNLFIDTPPELIAHEQITIVLPRSQLDHAFKDEKRYPRGFQVHVILSSLGHSVCSGDISSQASDLSSDTDNSDSSNDNIDE